MLFASAVSCQKGELNEPGGNALVEVIYPEVYAFDDVEKRLEIQEDYPVDAPFLKAVENFAYRSSAALLASHEKGENFNYSPLSLYFALAVATTGSGTGSQTQTELFKALGADMAFASSSQSSLPINLLSEQSRNLYYQLFRENEIGQLKIANSLWMDDEVNGQEILFHDDFVENAAENFFASNYSVDFSDKETTGAAMSDWVSTHTKGKIEPVFDFSPLQVLSILNTVYFYDQWNRRFEENDTAPDTFHLADGSEVEVDFMNQSQESNSYVRGENYTRAALPLKNGSEMIFVLPDTDVSPYDLVASSEKLEATFTAGESLAGEVVWKLPKFTFETKMDLKETMQELGVKEAFTENADFSQLTPQTLIYISDIKQDTYIAVDENGVEAAAFTQINFDTTSLPEVRGEMILDRPFLYGITAPNGSLLFIGVCENPTA
ncbi:MAG: serpin family protein [Eubacteriales bacterium]|nr:serpin family protein [Eubacteriales bacterium]